jgi:uncharacterized sporulation protein YeaH/YhbH (DUF444 family)
MCNLKKMAAEFDDNATSEEREGGLASSRIAATWRQAAECVRRKCKDRPPIIAQELAAECDRLQRWTSDANEHINQLSDELQRQAERIESRDETIRHQRYTIGSQEATNAVLRSTIDDLKRENTTLKANQCPSWAVDAKRVNEAMRNMGGE